FLYSTNSPVARYASPGSEARIVNRNPTRRKFVQQLRHSGRHLTISGNDHCPLQVLPKLSCTDPPSIESSRRRLSDPNQTPLSSTMNDVLPVPQWTQADKVIDTMR